MKKIKKRIIALFLSLIALVILLATELLPWKDNREITKEYDYTVQVVGIADGDSFVGLTEDSTEIRFRIYGIDAPEKSQPFSNEAKKLLSEMIFEKKVGIVVIEPSDKFNRQLVQVLIDDNVDVGAEMIKNGLAWHYRRAKETVVNNNYRQLETEAQKNKLGLWSQKNPESPWDFRKKKRQ